MITSLMKAKLLFFSTSSLSKLISNFSNDMGNLDLTFIFLIIQVLEVGFTLFILLINVFQINPFFIGVGCVMIILLVLIVIYNNQIILKAKNLDLKQKNPIYHELNEMVSGVIEKNMFEDKEKFIEEVNLKLDTAFRANIFYWNSLRFMGAYASIIGNISMFIGIMIGISIATP